MMQAVFVALLAAVFTALLAIPVFIVTQALASFVIEPTLEVRRVIGRTASALILYADIYSNPTTGDWTDDQREQARLVFRQLSSDLWAAGTAVPQRARKLVEWRGTIPPFESIRIAAEALLALSNGFLPIPDQPTALWNAERVKKIREHLRVSSF
jgi:hypothetical protein